MAFTRKWLTALGIEADKVDEIIEAHMETVNGLKAERDQLKTDAEKLASVEAELNSLKGKGDDGYKEKYESEHKAFEDYKSEIAARESTAAKESAVRAYFESKGISGKNLDIAMRSSAAERDAVELENGNIKDPTAFDELVSGLFSGLVSTTQTTGVNTSTPPANGAKSAALTKADILAIKDTAERQAAIADNLELFS